MATVIDTKRLCKRFFFGGGNIAALSNVSIRVNEGEFVAIMGASGSGKSTLMNLLGLLDRPTAGAYYLDDQNVTDLSVDRQARLRCQKIGFVFQSYNLLPRQRAVENVELPLIYAGSGAKKRRRMAVAALENVGLGHRLYHWPDQLSGGEQQRVAIARALVNDPRIILADEPTGALDSRTGVDVLAVFQALNRAGRTIVMVTHDPEIASRAKRIVTLSDGQIVGDEVAGISPTEIRRSELASGSCGHAPANAADGSPG